MKQQGAQLHLPKQKFTYLALGDSYTIGEQVPASENFPNQVVGKLAKQAIYFDPPDIVAKTGWTTDELLNAIGAATLHSEYDFVTLLIGVNNQYRGRDLLEYRSDLEHLVSLAIKFAGGDSSHVIVLSIPAWDVTPFAERTLPDQLGRTQQQVKEEIGAFNAVNKEIAERNHTPYIDITPGTREAVHDRSLLASDGLHPSGKEYEKWAEEVARIMMGKIKTQ